MGKKKKKRGAGPCFNGRKNPETRRQKALTNLPRQGGSRSNRKKRDDEREEKKTTTGGKDRISKHAWREKDPQKEETAPTRKGG